MTDVFISYSHEDRDFARRFADGFIAAGLSVWWDDHLRSGDAFDQKIELALRSAGAVVVLWSKSSVGSRWVRAEATLADRNNSLVPCMVEPCERPIMFELTHTADLSGWRGQTDHPAWMSFLADTRETIGRDQHLEVGSPTSPATAEPDGPTLAVLPFDNLSTDPEMQFFSDGVSEEISLRLAQGAGSLRVIGRTSSFQFRGERKANAAGALKATHVLDGSVRRAAGRVRISAQLIAEASQSTLWSERYDRSLEDIFAIQDEIADSIAAALNQHFSRSATASIPLEAYDLYLHGREVRGSDDWQMQFDTASLEKAVARAPRFAEAWAALALAHVGDARRTFTEAARASRARATVAARQALALDGKSAMAHVALSLLAPWCGAYAEREAHLARALSASPNDSHALHEASILSVELGRVREGHGRAARAFSIEPMYPSAAMSYAVTLFSIGEPQRGFEAFERASTALPDSEMLNVTPIYFAACAGDWKRTDALTAKLSPVTYGNPFAQTILGNIELLRAPGPKGKADALEVGRRQVSETGTISFAYLVYACLLGLVDEIYDLIEQASFAHLLEPGGQVLPGDYGPLCLFDAYNTALRQDPRFPRFCARLGLCDYWLATDRWPDCAETLAPYYDFREACRRAVLGTTSLG